MHVYNLSLTLEKNRQKVKICHQVTKFDCMMGIFVTLVMINI